MLIFSADIESVFVSTKIGALDGREMDIEHRLTVQTTKEQDRS